MKSKLVGGLVGAVLALGGCELYFGGGSQSHLGMDAGAAASPDAQAAHDANYSCVNTSNDDACNMIDCGGGRHCEVQCAPPGTDGCVYTCHPVCTANICCDNINCGPNKICVEQCLRDCQGMAQICAQTCVDANDTSCEVLTTEAACLARPDCIAIYRGANCTFTGNNTCGCQDEHAAFARCEAAVP